MSGFSRRRPGHEVNNLLDGRGRQRWLALFARFVAQQPINALLHKPRLPAPHHRLGFARLAHDLGGPAAISGGKDDLGAPHMLLRRAAIHDDRLKPMAIHRSDVDDNSCSHEESLHCFGRFGNRRMNQSTSWTLESDSRVDCGFGEITASANLCGMTTTYPRCQTGSRPG